MPSLVTGNEYMILIAGLAVCIVGGFIVALFKR
jgi:hypothetical protein